MLAFCGCIRDNLMGVDQRTRKYIGFTAALTVETRSEQQVRGSAPHLDIEEQEWPLISADELEHTRGSITSQLEGLEVGMFAHTLKVNNNQTEVKDLMTNKSFKFVDNEEMESVGEPVLWGEASEDGANKLRAYGYSKNGSFDNVETTDGKTILTYTVPDEIAKQTDIIATEVKEVASDYGQNIPIAFKHILTGVRFKVGFDCKVTSLKVVGVYNKGDYTIGDVWSNQSAPETAVEYAMTLPDGGKQLSAGDYISDENDILMMIPQQLPESAEVVMTYDGGNGNNTITAPLAGLSWNSGALVTYTIRKDEDTRPYIYFDLHAGNVIITPTSYEGYVYVAGELVKVSETNISTSGMRFYVYQSTDANKALTGYATALNQGSCRIPSYAPVKVGSKLWSEYITNNTSVEDVIETWDDGKYIRDDKQSAPNEGHIGTAVVRDAGRTHTKNYIMVSGSDAQYNLTIDNIYSVIQEKVRSGQVFRNRQKGGISFTPSGGTELRVNLVGDNRMGCLHIDNTETDKIIIEGTGSLTAADADFETVNDIDNFSGIDIGDTEKGYVSNHWASAIGGNTYSELTENVYNIYINSGIIFAGAAMAEDCTAIGGGGNGLGQVYISGGVVTAVARTAGTAIGGGMGHTANGGPGYVHISGGNVYAYNFANRWGIPSSAIGGGGSQSSIGNKGDVIISGGYVYAYSALGTAIGGGSSKTRQGGDAVVTISGGYIIARSGNSTCIGGGMGGDSFASNGVTPAFGGSATVTISGNPTIRTGSIGGGKTTNPEGSLGHAVINISGEADISAQFVMAGGAKNAATTFNMSGGTISNSDVHSKEYYRVQKNGGAVYMEDGTFTMSGTAKIRNCSADAGGAVYIAKSANANEDPKFEMNGGIIESCQSATDGGAVFLKNGSVTMSGGIIQNCLAQSGNGGAIYITEGNFSMSGTDTRISNNSALNHDTSNARSGAKMGDGGGIYVTSSTTDVDVKILSGTIENNTCDQNGGGVCVYMESASNSDEGSAAPEAIIQIGQSVDGIYSGPNINNNKAVLYGGGLYAKGLNAKITIDGGSISDNSVSNYVPNEDVSNEGGTVKLNNGEVSHKIVHFDVNTKNNDETAKVDGENDIKIVTATNSFLVAPSASRAYYDFVGWDTRKDGTGERYQKGETITVNLTANLTLYAQWKAQSQTN